jgi:putative membrane protein
MLYCGWGFGPGGWLRVVLGLLLWLLVIGLFVGLLVRVVRGPRHRYWMEGQHPADPEQLLRARFARGEIGADEFQQRLDVLRRTGPPPRK